MHKLPAFNSCSLQAIAQATGNPNDSAGAGVEVAVEGAAESVKTKDKADSPKVKFNQPFVIPVLHNYHCLSPASAMLKSLFSVPQSDYIKTVPLSPTGTLSCDST